MTSQMRLSETEYAKMRNAGCDSMKVNKMPDDSYERKRTYLNILLRPLQYHLALLLRARCA
jgi:hypothetical protein